MGLFGSCTTSLPKIYVLIYVQVHILESAYSGAVSSRSSSSNNSSFGNSSSSSNQRVR